MRLYLVRHGETTYNRDGLGLGRADAPLTDLGREQARRLGAYIDSERLDTLFSSPLGRAVETATAAAGGLGPRLAEALIELDVGHTEGLPFAEMRTRFPAFLREWGGSGGHTVDMPGGESLEAVDARVRPFLDGVVGSNAGSVMLVTHNFVLRVILCQLLGLPLASFRAFAVDLASVSIVDVEHGRGIVYRLNDTCHLQGT